MSAKNWNNHIFTWEIEELEMSLCHVQPFQCCIQWLHRVSGHRTGCMRTLLCTYHGRLSSPLRRKCPATVTMVMLTMLPWLHLPWLESVQQLLPWLHLPCWSRQSLAEKLPGNCYHSYTYYAYYHGYTFHGRLEPISPMHLSILLSVILCQIWAQKQT